MKGTEAKARDHFVPLSARCLEIVEAARGLSDGTGLVFPSLRGKLLSENTFNKLAQEIAEREKLGEITSHGFRSCFKDWCSELTDVPDELSEAALAHADKNKVRAAYARSQLIEKRRALMQRWSDYAAGVPASAASNVVPMKAATGG